MIENRKHVSVVIHDRGGDDAIALLRVPAGHQYTVEDAYAVLSDDLGASTANYLNVGLLNGGTAGTETDSIATAAGGTVGWSANVAKQIAITEGSGKLTAGQWLVANIVETGALAPAALTVYVDYVDGIGDMADA